MIADRTSASSGDTTSSRSSSVLEGAICSSGISSLLAGSRYWIRLWWDSSVSSSIRMPVCRSTSIIAQHQNPRCSSKVRSRRLPVAGSSAQIRPVVSVFITARRSVCPPAVNSEPAGASAGGLQPPGGGGALGVGPGDQGGQHRQPFPGPLVHPGLALGAVFLVGGLAGADRAAHRVRPPPGRVLVGPFGDVEVEGPDRGQHAAPVQPGGHRLRALAITGERRRGPGHHALFPGRGGIAGQLEGARCRDGGLPGRPRTACRAGRPGAAARRSPPTPAVRADSRPARRGLAGRLSVTVDQLLAGRLPAAGEHPHRRRRILAERAPGTQQLVEQRAVGMPVFAGRATAAMSSSWMQSPTVMSAMVPPLAAMMTAILSSAASRA